MHSHAAHNIKFIRIDNKKKYINKLTKNKANTSQEYTYKFPMPQCWKF